MFYCQATVSYCFGEKLYGLDFAMMTVGVIVETEIENSSHMENVVNPNCTMLHSLLYI